VGKGYTRIATNQMMQIKLMVLCKNHLAKTIVKVEKAGEATGVGHVVGNKGGVIIKFEMFNNTFAFVATHLAAHEDEEFLERRNKCVHAASPACVRVCAPPRCPPPTPPRLHSRTMPKHTTQRHVTQHGMTQPMTTRMMTRRRQRLRGDLSRLPRR
jgi:hypothetical protein